MKHTKKWTVYFLAAALALTMAGASAEGDERAAIDSEVDAAVVIESIDATHDKLLTGMIVQLDSENGEALVRSEELGEVIVRFDPALLADLPTLYPGATVTFETTGIMTMSLPAIMNAVKAETICLSGTFAGWADGMLLVDDADGMQVAAHVNAGPRVYGLENAAIGAPVTIFYNGMMTRSLPAQITADAIVFAADAQEATERESENDGQ